MSFQPTSTMLKASVVICAHNPRSDYFDRVLDGLRNQTLPFDQWELLIVDNASQVPLASSFGISWHPAARHILEREPGIAYARRRGIQEASADLVVFVDDDNVLSKDYLAEATRIKQDYPFLGVWGSGSIRGDFEIEPQDRVRSWLPVRELSGTRWSNLAGSRLFGFSPEDAIPWGAGMCVRRDVAVSYCQFFDQSSLKITGELAKSLVGCEVEDTEICLVCCRDGLGVGVFSELKLTHLLSRHRSTDDYIVRFAEGTSLSNMLLQYKWQHIIPQPAFGMRTLLSVLKTILFYRGVERKTRLAWVWALARAHKIIKFDLQNRETGCKG